MTQTTWLVYYSQHCTPTFTSFKTKRAALQFIETFETSPDDWIDCLIRGDVYRVYNDSMKYECPIIEFITSTEPPK